MNRIVAMFTGLFISSCLDVRGNPLRSLISVAGMIGAIVAVVVVNALGTVSEHATSRFIAERYEQPATVSISTMIETSDPVEFPIGPTYHNESETSWALQKMLKANGIQYVSPMGTTQVFILHNDGFTHLRHGGFH